MIRWHDVTCGKTKHKGAFRSGVEVVYAVDDVGRGPVPDVLRAIDCINKLV